jgi:hypothetical protein
MQLGRPAQRIAGTQAPLRVQSLRVQQRQPGQQHRIQSVALGVLGVVSPQIGRPLRGNQHHVRALASEPGRQWNPRVAGRFHHDGDGAGLAALGQAIPELLKVGRGGPEAVPGPDQLPALVGEAGLVRRADRDVDSHPQDH